jgi:hypothetical protein
MMMVMVVNDSSPSFPVRPEHDAIGHCSLQKLVKIDTERRPMTKSGGTSPSPSVANNTTATTTNTIIAITFRRRVDRMQLLVPATA